MPTRIKLECYCYICLIVIEYTFHLAQILLVFFVCLFGFVCSFLMRTPCIKCNPGIISWPKTHWGNYGKSVDWHGINHCYYIVYTYFFIHIFFILFILMHTFFYMNTGDLPVQIQIKSEFTSSFFLTKKMAQMDFVITFISVHVFLFFFWKIKQKGHQNYVSVFVCFFLSLSQI